MVILVFSLLLSTMIKLVILYYLPCAYDAAIIFSLWVEVICQTVETLQKLI